MRKVLICDPNPSTKISLCGSLEMEGFEVLTAQDAESARFKIIMESPDFVLIDWLEFDITHLDIKEFTSQLKRLRPDTLFVFISYRGLAADVLTFESLVAEHGADGYILKPFNLTHVAETLNHWPSKLTSWTKSRY